MYLCEQTFKPAIVYTFSYPLGTCNPSTAFNCGDYTCIPLEYRCDGVPDCQSGEDEINCVSPETCQEWWNAGYRENRIYKIRKDNFKARSFQYHYNVLKLFLCFIGNIKLSSDSEIMGCERHLNTKSYS